MKIINPSVEIIPQMMDYVGHLGVVRNLTLDGDAILKHLERCGRVCYKSEDKITDNSAKEFIGRIIAKGHETILEHVSVTVKFIVDRGISHEIVRHRLASYSQESSRYCNYGQDKFDGEITVIKPCFLAKGTDAWDVWKTGCMAAEDAYFKMLDIGLRPEEARSVLPNSLKTELMMTANLREWRHFLKLRTSRAAHPQMREVACMLLGKFKAQIPVIFEDINDD